MSITHCYSAGFYTSVTGDWSHVISTTGLVIIISALGFHFRALSRIERTVQEQMDRAKEAIAGRERRAGGSIELEEETECLQTKLDRIQRQKYCTLSAMGLVVGYGASFYCQLGCPAFDLCPAMGVQLRFLFKVPNKASLLEGV